MIELIGVTKLFGGRAAVRDLHLTVPTGAFCALVGTSGCGKSTTLRMINKLLPHDGGQIHIDGQQISQFNEQTLRRRIGYAIQSTGLFPHWTVAANIGLVPNLLGWPKAKVQERTRELMALLGLDEGTFWHKYPSQLSGGQAQRVGVARALAADPDILLMDEPFGALDPITREHLQNEMLRIQSRLRKTVVFVTHDMDEALKLATHVGVMHEGRLVQLASPETLLRQPANGYVESLLGSQDRGLKLAGLKTLAEVVQPDDKWIGTAARGQTVLNLSDSARTALSAMLWSGQNCLPVRNEQGQLVGEVTLDQLCRLSESKA
ncbi:MAG: ABC transporter ATP-binding protein [Natronospirillum sp.]|uniref:ABC transporter ATP-binding protein n=1 Tax=Natronospirillum sp. TaxID=2812955 RepID=UPI0025DECB65|nr:ABC transporter ATP-binding protein [Natronospirillum sp.]MCH8551545.1 ABC transporter ATP-binding protein [Natronospirillum sp.]